VRLLPQHSLFLLLLSPLFTLGQDYPSRPIRVVVPYSAGGSSDGPMRVIAQEMSEQLGQQMVVGNKPGQGAMLGSAEVVKAPPDGYTLLLLFVGGLGGADLDEVLEKARTVFAEAGTGLSNVVRALVFHPGRGGVAEAKMPFRFTAVEVLAGLTVDLWGYAP
jgi:hypothetical protein